MIASTKYAVIVRLTPAAANSFLCAHGAQHGAHVHIPHRRDVRRGEEALHRVAGDGGAHP
jgi:hypothetical protein